MEHAVIIRLPLDNEQFGSEERQAALFSLEDDLMNAVESADVGEFDGNEFGEGECTFFMYGPDADALWKAVEGVLQRSPAARGGYAIKRYGPADDPASREVRVTW